MICSGPQNLAQELKAIGDQLQELQKKLIQGRILVNHAPS